MHTVRLLLETTSSDEVEINKRFYALYKIHNIIVKRAIKLMTRLEHNQTYKALLNEYNKLRKEDNKRRKELAHEMNEIRKEIGLSEYGLQSYAKVAGKKVAKLLSSQQVQKEATRVYKGVEKILFSNGKKLHYRKWKEIATISGKNNTNGVKFNKETLCIDWLGLKINCKISKKEKTRQYIYNALKDDISYCEIKREMFNNGYHYYVIVYLKGDSPNKLKNVNSATMGIDLGTSTIACVSDNYLVLKELAPKAKEYNTQINKLLQKMDRSRRLANANKYHEDGTINKSNKDKWIYTNTYQKNANKLATLYRKKAAYIKQSHEILCNELTKQASTFIVETMNFKGLQKRSKDNEISTKASVIKQRDGSTKTIYKYQRKKRFGRSLNNRAPAMLITILERKCKLSGGYVLKVNTNTYRASQYNHLSDTYVKTSLKERNKHIGDYEVQRDLYSAFLLMNSNKQLDCCDREKCLNSFESFMKAHDELINEMKLNNISMKQCFGF